MGLTEAVNWNSEEIAEVRQMLTEIIEYLDVSYKLPLGFKKDCIPCNSPPPHNSLGEDQGLSISRRSVSAGWRGFATEAESRRIQVS